MIKARMRRRKLIIRVTILSDLELQFLQASNRNSIASRRKMQKFLLLLNGEIVLKNLPELESVDLISGYSNSERSQLQLALPECKVTSVRQST